MRILTENEGKSKDISECEYYKYMYFYNILFYITIKMI